MEGDILKNIFFSLGAVLLRSGAVWLMEAVYLGQYVFAEPIGWPLEIAFLCFFTCVMLALLLLESKISFCLLNPSLFFTVMSIIDFGFALTSIIFFCGIGHPVWSKDWDGIVAQIILIILRVFSLTSKNQGTR